VSAAAGPLFVLAAGPGCWLGKGGKHLSLCLVERLEDASVYLSLADARTDARRAGKVLGLALAPEKRALVEVGAKQ